MSHSYSRQKRLIAALWRLEAYASSRAYAGLDLYRRASVLLRINGVSGRIEAWSKDLI